MTKGTFLVRERTGTSRGAISPTLLLTLAVVAAACVALFATVKAVDEYQRRRSEQRTLQELRDESDALRRENERMKTAQDGVASQQQEHEAQQERFRMTVTELTKRALPKSRQPLDHEIFTSILDPEAKMVSERLGEVMTAEERLRLNDLRAQREKIDTQLRDAKDGERAARLRAERAKVVGELRAVETKWYGRWLDARIRAARR